MGFVALGWAKRGLGWFTAGFALPRNLGVGGTGRFSDSPSAQNEGTAEAGLSSSH